MYTFGRYCYGKNHNWQRDEAAGSNARQVWGPVLAAKARVSQRIHDRLTAGLPLFG